MEPSNQLSQEQTGQVSALKKMAAAVIAWLVLLNLASIVFGVILLGGGITSENTVQLVLLCIAGGTLGSSISALVSVAERISHGWELSGGAKYPQPDPPDKFVARMVPFFLVRPFLGSAMGLLVYAGLKGGYLIALENASKSSFSREALLFLAFLGGMFAKTFIERLRDMFDTLFGKSGK